MLSFTMEEFERKLKLGLELKQKQTDSFIVATICRRNRKCYSLPSTFKAEARFRVKTKVPPRSRKFRTIPTPHFWSEKMLSFTMVEFEGKLKLGLELKQKNPRSHKLRTIFTPHFWSG